MASGEWGGQDILGGQVYMVANNALPQYGTHTPLFQVSPLSLDLSFLFASCGSFPFYLSFIPISRPSPSSDTAKGLGSAVSSPSGSGQSPAATWNLVNSGPRNERFLTCQRGKLQCSLNSLIICFLFSDSINCSGQFTNTIFTNVSK